MHRLEELSASYTFYRILFSLTYSFAFSVYWPRVNQPLEHFVLYNNCFFIVISPLPSFRPNDLSITFSIQLLTALHYLH
jgi:hypothetical protein